MTPATQKVMFSSAKTDWGTPQDFFDRLDKEFGFTLDVCASAENAKCKHYYTEEQDALKQEWRGVCWMNPPYGKTTTPKWVHKAYISALQNGATVVCLLPSRTDTAWFHKCLQAGEVRFVKGRLKFEGADDAAPFPSVVVIFHPYLRTGNGTIKSIPNKI